MYTMAQRKTEKQTPALWKRSERQRKGTDTSRSPTFATQLCPPYVAILAAAPAPRCWKSRGDNGGEKGGEWAR